MDARRLGNVAGLPSDIEIESGWDACVASMARPATQERIQELIGRGFCKPGDAENRLGAFVGQHGDRKSTRLNSSHSQISYAVFCLKKKKNQKKKHNYNYSKS